MDINNLNIDGFDTTEYKNPDNELPIGTVLRDRYVVGRELGSGNFGITYLGYDLKYNNVVAIKEFYLFHYVDRDSKKSKSIAAINGKNEQLIENRREKFRQESDIVKQIAFTEISVPVYEYFEDNNTAYIVMEFVPGKTLEKYITEKSKLSIDETASLILPMAKALQVIHEKNVIHRDIKPDNIIITPEGKPKLLDFGSAKEYTSEVDGKTILVFTENYAAMEQRSIFSSKGPWTDVYGLCAVMYSCLTGEVPPSSEDRSYQDDPDKELISKLLEAVGNNNSELCCVISRGMALDAEDRYQSMKELLKDLAPCLMMGNKIGKIIRTVNRKIKNVKDKIKKRIKKANKKKLAIVSLFIITVIVASVLLIKNYIHERTKGDINSLGDGQIVYISSSENRSDAEVNEAFEEIKGRLDILCKKKEYTLNINGRQGELFVPYDVFNCGDPVTILENLVFRPAKISLAYDSANAIDLNPESIRNIENADGTITLWLNDDVADEIREKVGEWAKLGSKYDSSSILLVDIEDYDDMNESPYDEGDNENLDLKLHMDYDLYLEKNGKEDLYFDAEIGEDGHNIVLSSSEENSATVNGGIILEELRANSNAMELFKNDICNDHFDDTFDTSYNSSAKWERNKKTGNVNSTWGKNQVNPNYFLDNNIEAVDVLFTYYSNNEAESEGTETVIDNWVENRNWIASTLDRTETKYAIGKAADGKNSIVLRLPAGETGYCYYGLVEDSHNGDISFRLRTYDDNEAIFLNTGMMEYENGTVSLEIDNNLYDIDIEDGSEVVYYFEDEENNYLLGVFDEAQQKMVFDRSSFGKNGEVPSVFENYIKLFNVQYENYSATNKDYLNNYYFNKITPVHTDLVNAFNETELGLTNMERLSQGEVLATSLANVLGNKPKVTTGYNTFSVDLSMEVSDHYADSLSGLLERTMEFCSDDMTSIDKQNSINFWYEIKDFDEHLHTRIVIETGQQNSISIMFWDNLTVSQDKKSLQEQLWKLKNDLENSEVLSGYDISLKKIYM